MINSFQEIKGSSTIALMGFKIIKISLLTKTILSIKNMAQQQDKIFKTNNNTSNIRENIIVEKVNIMELMVDRK